jgi:hypothetical protein
MTDQQPNTGSAPDPWLVDSRFAIRSAAAIVFVAACLVGFVTETGCTGGDTSPTSPAGSPHHNFCDHVDFGLAILIAPLLTLCIGFVATSRRSTALALVATALGMSLAVAPLVVETTLSWDCPRGSQEAGGQCYP